MALSEARANVELLPVFMRLFPFCCKDLSKWLFGTVVSSPVGSQAVKTPSLEDHPTCRVKKIFAFAARVSVALALTTAREACQTLQPISSTNVRKCDDSSSNSGSIAPCYGRESENVFQITAIHSHPQASSQRVVEKDLACT
jgi:hypothetical protein